jgi:uncharacterized protein
MELTEVKVENVYSLEDKPNSAVLVLETLEEKPKRFTVGIGILEGNYLLFLVRKMERKSLMPLDLFFQSIRCNNMEVEKVSILKLENGVFYCTVFCRRTDEVFEFDARISDAVLSALTYGKPIYIDNELLGKLELL